MKIFLASRSERRRQLLEQIGIQFHTIDIEIDETYHPHESPDGYVLRMAYEKAEQGKQKTSSDSIIIAADTSVILDNEVLGKAETSEQAFHMLNQLSGRRHEVMTAVAVAENDIHTDISTTQVCFCRLSHSKNKHYIATNEPIGKARAYAIQGYAAKYIERIEGSYSAVMGLPLYETAQLLKETLIKSELP